jgi:hypothetical protein
MEPALTMEPASMMEPASRIRSFLFPVALVLAGTFGHPSGTRGQDPGESLPGDTDTSAAAATITYLLGDGWRPYDGTRDVLSVEYSSSGAYGDNYFLFEAYELLAVPGSGRVAPTVYGEWHPRLSLTEISGGRIRVGPISNVHLAGEVNLADDFTALLYGAGLDWRLPDPLWLVTNFYVRDDQSLPGTTWHTLAVIGADFRVGSQRLRLFGYVDAFGSEGTRDGMIYSELQVLFDIGHLVLERAGRLFTGIELHVSENAFGNGSGFQLVPQFAVQWAF